MDKEIRIFKALSDPIRLRLALMLAQGSEICVCKLVETLQEPQFKVSRHLGILKNAGLVEARRQGTWMYYRMVATGTVLDKSLRELFKEMGKHQPQIRKDLQKFKTLQCQIKMEQK